MRYIGSKSWCLEKLLQLVLREAPGATSICDPFAGTCTVARFFKSQGFRVSTGDLLSLSYALQVACVKLNQTPKFKKLLPLLGQPQNPKLPVESVLSYLNSLPGRVGWVTRNFSLAGKERRKFFTIKNARHLDSVLAAIRKWARQGLISKTERWYLLASAIDAADRVANTAGTYYAHLNTFYRKARRPLMLRPIEICNNGHVNSVRKCDASKRVQTVTDVLYLDPPYNERDYGSYYHLPEMLASDQTSRVSGRSGQPVLRPRRSPCCSRSTATEHLRKVLRQARARVVILHYAEQGIVLHKDIIKMLRNLGPTRSRLWESRAYASTRAQPIPPRFRTRLYICHPE